MKNLFGKRPKDSDDGGFVLLARFPEMWQADLAVSLLASEGIEAWSADEIFINGTSHSNDMGGVGVMVREADAMPAWTILQMAERGELALPDDHDRFFDEASRRETEKRDKSFRRKRPETLNLQPATRNFDVVRCPRCGSENTEKRKGIRALFSPGRRCRVCQWEWK